jgi:hypothetical protein
VTDATVGRDETAMWVVVALLERPRTVVGLLDAVRDLDGRIGPGRLLGAVARLERLAVIEPSAVRGPDRTYRLRDRQLSDGSASPTMSNSTEASPG